MQAKGAGISRRRITVFLDISGSNRLLLDMLPSLFDENGDVDIDAVLVEETAHRHAAELPFVRELCLLTTMERDFGPNDLERIIEVRKKRLRKILETAVRRPGVAYSIRSVRAAANLLPEAVSISDITIFVPVRRLRRQFMGLPESPARRRGRVVVVIGDWPGARDALLTGLRLAGGDQRRIAVLVVGDATGAEEMDCAARITALLSAAPAGIQIVPGKDPKALIHATLLQKPDTLVLGASPEWLDSTKIRMFGEQLNCPVCVVMARP